MLNYNDFFAAYLATIKHFNLNTEQCTMLQASPDSLSIGYYAHLGRWYIVEMFLRDNKII